MICWLTGVPDVVWDTAQVLLLVEQPASEVELNTFVEGGVIELPLELPPELLELLELELLELLLEVPLELLLELLTLVDWPLMPVDTVVLPVVVLVLPLVDVVTMVEVPVALLSMPTAFASVLLTLVKNPVGAAPLTKVMAYEYPVLRPEVQESALELAGMTELT